MYENYTETFSAVEGRRVIIRATNSGVHVGTFARVDGDVVVILDTYRILEWEGAESLSEISLGEVDRKRSNFSKRIARNIIREWIEIIPVADGVDL